MSAVPVGVAARLLAGAALTAVALSGCQSGSPDYQSIWTSPATTTTTADGDDGDDGEKPVPIADYLEEHQVSGELVAPADLTDLRVSIPTPPGWSPSTNEHYSPEAVAIAKDDNYPIAILLVMALDGDFDVAEAISHGNGDARINENFTELETSDADFNGFPSTMIEGSYDYLGQRLHSYNRIVIPTVGDDQRYLVQLTITSLAQETVTHSDDIEAIIGGFTVAAV